MSAPNVASATSMPFYKTPWFEWLAIFFLVGLATWLLADFEMQLVPNQPSFRLPHALTHDPSHLLDLARCMLSGKGYGAATGSFILGLTPPLMPTFLAALMKMTGHHTLESLGTLLFWMNVTCVGISAIFVFRALTRWLVPPFPLVIAGLLTLAPCTLLEVTYLDLTLPFLAVSAFTIWLVDKRLHAESLSRWELSGCTFWSVSCAMLHPAGWAIMLAFLVACLLKQGRSAAIFVALLSLGLCLPWLGFLVWQLSHSHAVHSLFVHRPIEALHHGHLWAIQAMKSTLHPAFSGRVSMAWQTLPDLSKAAFSVSSLAPSASNATAISAMPALDNVTNALWQVIHWLSSNRLVQWVVLSLSSIGVLSKLNAQAGMPSLFVILTILGIMFFGLGQSPVDDYALWPWLVASPVVGLLFIRQWLSTLKCPNIAIQSVQVIIWGLLGIIAIGHLQTILQYPHYQLANQHTVERVRLK
ncbi:MAG: hypothetical protein VKK59_07390 [Vampirovibrionales bacterium]|nr:hypothetical protein [Vampirovibrionales bacterium]